MDDVAEPGLVHPQIDVSGPKSFGPNPDTAPHQPLRSQSPNPAAEPTAVPARSDTAGPAATRPLGDVVGPAVVRPAGDVAESAVAHPPVSHPAAARPLDDIAGPRSVPPQVDLPVPESFGPDPRRVLRPESRTPAAEPTTVGAGSEAPESAVPLGDTPGPAATRPPDNVTGPGSARPQADVPEPEAIPPTPDSEPREAFRPQSRTPAADPNVVRTGVDVTEPAAARPLNDVTESGAGHPTGDVTVSAAMRPLGDVTGPGSVHSQVDARGSAAVRRDPESARREAAQSQCPAPAMEPTVGGMGGDATGPEAIRPLLDVAGPRGARRQAGSEPLGPDPDSARLTAQRSQSLPSVPEPTAIDTGGDATGPAAVRPPGDVAEPESVRPQVDGPGPNAVYPDADSTRQGAQSLTPTPEPSPGGNAAGPAVVRPVGDAAEPDVARPLVDVPTPAAVERATDGGEQEAPRSEFLAPAAESTAIGAGGAASGPAEALPLGDVTAAAEPTAIAGGPVAGPGVVRSMGDIGGPEVVRPQVEVSGPETIDPDTDRASREALQPRFFEPAAEVSVTRAGGDAVGPVAGRPLADVGGPGEVRPLAGPGEVPPRVDGSGLDVVGPDPNSARFEASWAQSLPHAADAGLISASGGATGPAADRPLGDVSGPGLVRPAADGPGLAGDGPDSDSARFDALRLQSRGPAAEPSVIGAGGDIAGPAGPDPDSARLEGHRSQSLESAAGVPHPQADGRESAAGWRQESAAEVAVRPRNHAVTEPPAHQIAVEMAARHELEITGFHAARVDIYAVREIAAAIDDMLGKYPIALRGIAITDPDDGVGAVRGGSSETPRSKSRAIWMVLHGPTLATLVPPTGNAPPRRWLRRRRTADRPVYAAVVREFGCALEVAGDFRARQEAQRRLVTESLRGGADLAYSPLDPGPALVDAFTEVALYGDRAGKLAKALHDMLVKMAGAETTDLSA